MIFFNSAIWVWKGQNLAFELSEDWQIDYASYQWSKLDPKVHFSHIFIYFAWIIIHDISYSMLFVLIFGCVLIVIIKSGNNFAWSIN